MLKVGTFACAMLLLAATPSRADLIDLGNGMIYDSLQNLTWLQDTHYARTSGFDSDGKMTQSDAVLWTQNLTFGGFDDWRLPNATRSSTVLDNSSEVSTLLTQLGWHWPAWGSVEPGGVGPFTNFFAGGGIPTFWLDRSGTIFNMIYAYDLRDGPPSNPSGVWAVRDGNPTARVPEPTTLMFVGIGIAAAYRLRRRVSAGS